MSMNYQRDGIAFNDVIIDRALTAVTMIENLIGDDNMELFEVAYDEETNGRLITILVKTKEEYHDVTMNNVQIEISISYFGTSIEYSNFTTRKSEREQLYHEDQMDRIINEQSYIKQ